MIFPSHRHILPALVLTLCAAAQAGTLKVGDPTPPFPVAKWFKGTPVTSFEPGRIYVVEFWATWCGPCRKSIPHLTELAKRFSGKVTFTGISIMEKKAGPGDTTYLKGVEDFVKEQGDSMAYHVGADGPEGVLANTWFKASGSPGIPTAIIVNGEGKIHWIGHPMALDTVLDAILAGTFDAKSAAVKREAEVSRRLESEKAMAPFFAAMKNSDFPEAAKFGAALLHQYPETENAVGYVYYMALGHTDQPKAEVYARNLVQGTYRENARGLGELAGAMINNPSQSVDLILQVADQARTVAHDSDNPFYLDLCAQAHGRAGHRDRAATLEEQAIKAALAGGIAPSTWIEKAKIRLKSYQAGA